MPEYEFIDGWIIREKEYVLEEEASRATVFALANGYMGCRGAGEEIPAAQPGAKGCYINGIYDTPEGRLTEREIPNAQDWTAVQVAIDGQPFDPRKGTLLDYSRELDMRQAVMRRRIRWRSPSGKVLILESERFLSMTWVNIGAIRYRVAAEEDSEIELTSSIDARVNNRWARHFKDSKTACSGRRLYLETKTFEPGYTIGVMASHRLEIVSDSEEKNQVMQKWAASGSSPDQVISATFKFPLAAGKTAVLIKIVSVRESRFAFDCPSSTSSEDAGRQEKTAGKAGLETICMTDLDEAEALGYDKLRAEHIDRWEELWDTSDVIIDSNEDAQMGIRFAIFHLLSAAPFHSDLVSIPARGLQGQDYYGSIFWDCEIFCLPLLIYTQPQAARNALRYRYHTLDGARRKAAGLGFKGAYYAWQSQETGDEQCDLYVFDNPLTGEKIRSYFADEQIHISADIVYAARQYYNATGDESFWIEGGAEIAAEVARFFVSRASLNEASGRYEFHSVLGPDEYHERVDNNAFTNVMAAESIRTALDVLGRMSREAPAAYHMLVERIGLQTEELQKWEEVLSRIYIPAPCPDTGIIPQFDGYLELRDEPIEETRKRLAHPEMYPGGPSGPYQETQNIKQADVIMLLYLFRDRYDRETKRQNWEYYEKRTAHDSSLSPMAYSLVAADVGMIEWAYKYFMYSSHIDLGSYGPHWNMGIHAASLGGAWLALVHGFCQINLDADGIRVAQWPKLPAHWKRVAFSFLWHGNKVRYESDGRSLTLTSLAAEDVPILLPDGPAVLPSGGAITRRTPKTDENQTS